MLCFNYDDKITIVYLYIDQKDHDQHLACFPFLTSCTGIVQYSQTLLHTISYLPYRTQCSGFIR